MALVVGVRFKRAGKVYYFDPGEFDIPLYGKVVVETARGIEYGEVAVAPRDVPEDEVVQPLKKVLRPGTDKDALIAAENKRKEKEAFVIAQKKIEAHALDMNLVDVEYTFDGSKNIFYFTAEGRVDFRELVRDLASVFRTRIEMRQIGVRDEAKLLGGIGPCGRILCCTSFLGDFAPVSIRMAKDQNLSLNPSKISGLCGRLMCCLRFEQDTYEAAKKDPTLAPGYVPPVIPADEPMIEDDEPRRPAAVKRSGGTESGLSARVAQAAGLTERPVRREDAERRPQRGGPQGKRPEDRPQGDRGPAMEGPRQNKEFRKGGPGAAAEGGERSNRGRRDQPRDQRPRDGGHQRPQREGEPRQQQPNQPPQQAQQARPHRESGQREQRPPRHQGSKPQAHEATTDAQLAATDEPANRNRFRRNRNRKGGGGPGRPNTSPQE